MTQRPTPPDSIQDREPVGLLDPGLVWFTAPETRQVMAALSAEGQAARFVGGCVRDSLAHRLPTDGRPDVDIATETLPEDSLRLLEAAGVKVVPTGLAHGTVTAVVGAWSYEITTLRRDLACDGRHAEVAFTDSFREDAARRDFTINALSADAEGRIYDYFDGIPDLTAGRVRFIGRALDRITEDGLRILRFFRFQAHYGLPPPDRAAMEACASLVDMVDHLSRERVRKELLRILEAPDPAGALVMMRNAKVLERVLPDATGFAALRVLVLLETRGVVLPGLGPAPLRRMAAALGAGDGEVPQTGWADRLAETLRLSKREGARLTAMLEIAAPDRPDPGWSTATLARQLDRWGSGVVIDRLLLTWAAERAVDLRHPAARTDAWRRLLEAALEWRSVPFPLTGHDVQKALGIPAGPEVGDVLARLRDWWLEEGRPADRHAVLEALRLDLGKDRKPVP